MNRKIRIALYAFIALSILGLAVAVFVHQQTQNTLRVSFTEDNKLEVRVDRIRYSGTREGRVEWEFEADYATREKDEDLTVFSNVAATFYPRGSAAPYTLKAREGRYWEAKGVVHAAGAVRVESRGLFVLETEKLEMKMESRKISTALDVAITSDMMDVRGRGLEAEVDTGSFRILSNVRAVFYDAARK